MRNKNFRFVLTRRGVFYNQDVSEEKRRWKNPFGFIYNPISNYICQFFWGILLREQVQKKKLMPVSPEVTYEGIKFIIQEFEVVTKDGVKISSASIKQETCITPRCYIVRFLGRKGRWEEERHLKESYIDAKALNAVIMVFNYRHCGKSDQKRVLDAKDLVLDGIAQVERLLEMGVSHNKIFLKGESLGAGVATEVFGYYYKMHRPVFLTNIRSFGKLSDASFYTVKNFSKPLYYTTYPILCLLSKYGPFEINSAEILKNVPRYYWNHITIRPHEENGKRGDDFIIPYEISLHVALRQERQKLKPVREDGESDENFKVRWNKYKHNKASEKIHEGHHSKPLSDTKNRHGRSANEHFHQFVKDRAPEIWEMALNMEIGIFQKLLLRQKQSNIEQVKTL